MTVWMVTSCVLAPLLLASMWTSWKGGRQFDELLAQHERLISILKDEDREASHE